MRWSTVLGALLLAVSLGLPWGHSTFAKDTFHPPIVPPVQCAQVLDWAGQYQIQCSPTYVVNGWLESHPETVVVLGAGHAGRFGVVAGLALIAAAWRWRRRRHLMLAACVVSVSTGLCAGFGSGLAGPSLAWLSVLLLGWGSLDGWLLLARRRLRPSPEPSVSASIRRLAAPEGSSPASGSRCRAVVGGLRW